MHIDRGNMFSDGTTLEWPLREPVPQAKLCRRGKSSPWTDAHWACTVLDNTGGEVERLEVLFGGVYKEWIPLPWTKISVRDLLTLVHDFHHDFELDQEFIQDMDEDDRMYADEEARQGNPVHPIDFMGSMPAYEGFVIEGNVATLNLGS